MIAVMRTIKNAPSSGSASRIDSQSDRVGGADRIEVVRYNSPIVTATRHFHLLNRHRPVACMRWIIDQS